MIEAAAEDESVKREIFKTLVPHLGERPDRYAVAISITALRPSRTGPNALSACISESGADDEIG